MAMTFRIVLGLFLLPGLVGCPGSNGGPAAPTDAGPTDAGVWDAGVLDAGAADAGPGVDAGPSWTANVTVTQTGGTTIDGGTVSSSTKLFVSWAAPTGQMTVDHFLVTATESIGGTSVSTTALGTATNATIAALKAATPYALTVTACLNSACTSTATASGNTGNGTTREEVWQLQGDGGSVSGLTKIVSDGNVRIAGFAYGADASADLAGRVQLYYGPTADVVAGLVVATTASAASASNPTTFVSFTSFATASGLRTPDGGSTLVSRVATGQGVPLSSAMGSKVRLFFEADGTDGKVRIMHIDSKDGHVGKDFNAGAPTYCLTSAEYSPDGGCAPTVDIGVEGDATNANLKIQNARQFKVGVPTLTDWRWDGATGTFMVFTVDAITGCATAFANHAYAVWDGSKWNVQYEAGGCPKLFKSAQAAHPVHLGGVRFKLTYGNVDDQTGKVQGSQLPFLGPKVQLYADGTRTGDAGVVDFEDWEATAQARGVAYLWPNGTPLSATAEGYIDDFTYVMPTGSLDLQVMYLAITDGTIVPFSAAAILLNP